jgi:hypothetical protein
MGDLQTGILDGGFNVYNSKDMLHQKAGLKINYFVLPNIKLNLSYTNVKYDEFQNKNSLKNNIVSFGFNYTF